MFAKNIRYLCNFLYVPILSIILGNTIKASSKTENMKKIDQIDILITLNEGWTKSRIDFTKKVLEI